MANLEDFDYTSILDMSNDEALNTIRQLRLSRRVSEKKTTTRASNKKTISKITESIDSNMANRLLDIIGGKK